MNAIRERRKRAVVMREQKRTQMFLQELLGTSMQNSIERNVFETNKESKTKKLRMQNAKGTSGMFIKP
tara:strand:- start:446 stop:649 length:204 start_codon:yes stop_codon:yes gene_type:complete